MTITKQGHDVHGHSSVLARFTVLMLIAGLAVFTGAQAGAQVNVLTGRNNNARNGLNASETLLNSANVKSTTFAKLGAYSVDGYVVAQPLYMSNISISGGLHNVVFVADQHDSVYAFDADNPGSGIPLWQVSFINPAAGVTTVPITEQGCAVVNGYTEMGIQSTPVIDPVSNTLYVEAKTKETVNGVTTYVHRLHALDITNGHEKFGGPVTISGSVQGQHGLVVFDPSKGCQRPALLLTKGTVFIGFGSNGCDNTRGWIFAYNATTLAQVGIFNTSPNQVRGANVWQGGAGLAADDEDISANTNLFFITANGIFNANTGGSDFGDTFMKLTLPSTGALAETDYFTPFDQATMGANDLDLGSGGITLLPDEVGSTDHPHLAIGAGKTGTVYLVDRDNMGHFHANDNSQIVQWIQDVLSEVEGTPAYWDNTVYFAPVHNVMSAYSISNASLSLNRQSQAVTPIGSLSISANNNTNGILWLIRQLGASSAMLSAFDAITMAELYNSNLISSRDGLGPTAHFSVPTIANGKAYVGTQAQLVIYGLLPVLSPISGGNQTGAAGSTLPLPLTVRAIDSYTGNPRVGVTVTFSDGGKKGTFGSTTVITDSTGTASTTYKMPNTFQGPTITITATSPGFASATWVETVVAGAPASILLVSGGNQTGTVGTTLPAPIVVKVADTFGNGVSGVSVSFSSTQGGQFNPPGPITTDSLGRATVAYTLPTTAGFITINASSGTLTPKAIMEHAVAGPATSLAIVSGNNQHGRPNTLLAQALVVRAADQFNNAVANVTVNFTDNGAGGVLSSKMVITNASGKASVSYTTGSQTGTVTITASASGLTSVNFTETVQ
jgi:hypothetical protein